MSEEGVVAERLKIIGERGIKVGKNVQWNGVNGFVVQTVDLERGMVDVSYPDGKNYLGSQEPSTVTVGTETS